MAKYQKRPDLGSVYVPGVGRVTDARVLDGNFDRFVPSLLVRMPDEAAPAPTRAPVRTPAPAPAEPPVRESEPTLTMNVKEQAALVDATKPNPNQQTQELDAKALAELTASERAAAQQQRSSSAATKKQKK